MEVPRTGPGVGESANPIRIVAATQGMLESLTQAHMEAFPGAMSTRLGERYLWRFFRWFVEAREAIALVALDGDDARGYVVGAPLGYHRQLNRDLATTVLCSLLGRPWLLLAHDIRRQLWRRANMIGLTPDSDDIMSLPAPCFSLVGIGVSPRAQGRGVGRNLLVTFEEAATRRGASALRLSVNPGNDRARRLYENLGWRQVGASQPGSIYYAKIMDRTNAGPMKPEAGRHKTHG